MDREYDLVLEEVLALDRESQISIAETVLTSISKSPEHEAAWRVEIRKRTDAYRRGELSTVDSEEVMTTARQRIEEARSRG